MKGPKDPTDEPEPVKTGEVKLTEQESQASADGNSEEVDGTYNSWSAMEQAAARFERCRCRCCPPAASKLARTGDHRPRRCCRSRHVFANLRSPLQI